MKKEFRVPHHGSVKIAEMRDMFREIENQIAILSNKLEAATGETRPLVEVYVKRNVFDWLVIEAYMGAESPFRMSRFKPSDANEFIVGGVEIKAEWR